MAKGATNTESVFKSMADDIAARRFSPVYLLMGEEQFYIDRIYSMLMENVLDEAEKDFNLTVLYGADVSGGDIANAALRYPMMAERQLVVVREAQSVSRLDELVRYAASPLDTTVLVLCYMGKSLDKRTALYKEIAKNGMVLESSPVRDYELPRWIVSYFSSLGYGIHPDAAALLAEYSGTDLSKIAVEGDKIVKSMDAGRKDIQVSDVEQNVGITRQFSIFELTKALSFRDVSRAFTIAAYLGASPRFALPAAVNALFLHFYRILKYAAFLKAAPSASASDRAKEIGVNPYFLKEYDTALRNFPVRKCMAVIADIKEYDFKSKGGDAGEATQGELLLELVSRILAR